MIIELKENQAIKNDDETKHINGKYRVSLKNNLTLNQGDELNIRNIFIDSTQTAGEILVKTDTTLTMEFVKGATMCYDMEMNSDRSKISNNNYILLGEQNSYNSLDDPTLKDPLRSLRRNTDNNYTYGDTFTYYPCKNSSTSAVHAKAVSIEFQPTLSGNNNISQYGGVTVQFTYKNINNEFDSLFLKLDSVSINERTHTQDLSEYEQIIYTVADKIIAINPTPKELKEKYHIETYNFNGESVPNGQALVLAKSKKSIVIPGGKSYNPSTLAELMTYEFNKVDDESKHRHYIKNNDNAYSDRSESLFSSSTDENSLYGSTYYLDTDDTGIRWYVAEDGGSYMVIQGYYVQDNNSYYSNDIYGGCDSFTIIYDETTQSFKIQNLHSPYYLDIGGPDAHPPNFEIGHKITQKKVNSPANTSIFFNDTKRGDIIITGLTSSNLDDSDNSNFWFDSLGFSANLITSVGYSSKHYQPVDANVSIPIFNKVLGTNSTDVLIEQNVKMLKGNFTFNIFNDYPENGVEFLNSNTTEIIAEKSISELSEKEGYYIVRIKANYASNKLYTPHSTEMISAIVSKYYTNSGYSTGFSSDGISYIHMGSSIAISDFEIEILDSNKNNPVDLGADSSLYLEIIPGQPEK